MIAQPISLELWGGVSSYQGDIQTKLISNQLLPMATGLGVTYPISNKISVNSFLRLGSLQGDDKSSSDPQRQKRNLSFKTHIYEWSILMRISIFKLDSRRFNPFFELGAATFHFNPYTYDSFGNKQYLNPLGTEGQGLSLYPTRKRYSLIQLSIPINAGINIKINESTAINWNFGWRKSFTDYIDDISTTYADANALLAKNSKSLEMAFRSKELDATLNYPSSNFPRGNAKNMDGYFFMGFGVSYKLQNSGNSGDMRSSNHQLNCPKF